MIDDVNNQPERFTEPSAIAQRIIERVGKRIVLGLPLGIGKATHVVNALYQLAEQDRSISLSILTALTPVAPTPKSELERRFLEPVMAKFFAGYPKLHYVDALRHNSLPPNIQVQEFYFQPGAWLGNDRAQQDYNACNYTHALEVLLREGVNVMASLVAPEPPDKPGRVSLSSNPDIAATLLTMRRRGEIDLLTCCQLNDALPFMGTAADVAVEDFDLLLEGDAVQFPLFMPPHEPVSPVDHAIGLHAARLIPDGGTLQIGIGSIGEAIAHGLVLRQRENDKFQQLCDALGASWKSPGDHREAFATGLYGVSEMLVEGFLELIDAGVLKREVDGRLVHAAFFLGSPLFYRALSEMPASLRDKIAMCPVSFVNELYGTEEEKRRARVNARFINSAMMVTLTGAAVSDGLDDGRVISGVGGQYNFVAQAFALQGARSIITLRATRTKAGKTESNIRWNYGHCTIPRHLRDIVVTEYGIADLRGKSDAKVIAELLNITDSRFQEELLETAKSAGKIAKDYEIPERYRANTPQRIRNALHNNLPTFPLGTDFNAEEQRLAPALRQLATAAGSTRALTPYLWRGLTRRTTQENKAALVRMGLDGPRNWKERIYRWLVLGALDH